MLFNHFLFYINHLSCRSFIHIYVFSLNKVIFSIRSAFSIHFSFFFLMFLSSTCYDVSLIISFCVDDLDDSDVSIRQKSLIKSQLIGCISL